ncbi:hypothetical protein BT67DRAFT_201591 [Trichocladium antarcticum]|uniref:Uncharacterized protein n=1 Tax=Trichocladium antarcticum TaxID=1450529 RepID=A0AAN6UQ06_9PEZI|nr:hypothetical protein BT67DRAFT_201591 [Trichocladium antarcticum]
MILGLLCWVVGLCFFGLGRTGRHPNFLTQVSTSRKWYLGYDGPTCPNFILYLGMARQDAEPSYSRLMAEKGDRTESGGHETCSDIYSLTCPQSRPRPAWRIHAGDGMSRVGLCFSSLQVPDAAVVGDIT